MKQEERRKYKRVKIHYPITYCCLDIDGNVIEEMMGVAIDISQSGILIESPKIISTKDVLLISIDLKKNVIELKCEVVYRRRLKNGRYRIGMRFNGSHEINVAFATKIAKAYHYLKKPST